MLGISVIILLLYDINSVLILDCIRLRVFHVVRSSKFIAIYAIVLYDMNYVYVYCLSFT